MAKYLVIVESPAKVKTVKKFLGANYEVAASNGHVRDLPKSQLGIDVEHDFEPKYITIRGKGELLAGLRKSAKKADKVYLATDPDREGEAISWHLSKALNLDEKKMRRITFNEITKTAVKASLKEARSIDMNLVDEQQARRCLDRMVGYEISPLLWKKIKRGLSAGRVQSVALRIIGGPGGRDQRVYPQGILDSGRGIPDPRGEEASDSAFLRKRKGKNQSGFRETAGRNFERTGGMQLFCGGTEKGRAQEKSAPALYHQHHAAGGGQGAEFFLPRKPCAWPSSCMRALRSRATAPWD